MKLRLPQISASVLTPVSASKLIPEASLEQIRFADIDASGVRAPNMSLDEVLFHKVLLAGAQLEKLRVSDAELRLCDLSAANCNEGSLIRVRIVGGRMTGVDFSRSTIQDVVFEDCKLNLVNFRSAKLKRVRFRNCVLTEADFQMAELTDVEFQASHLEKVAFDRCKLIRVDARNSLLFDLRGWQSLRGLIIDSSQLMTVAPELAMELGIIVKE